jgi:predicted dienelactone hydrolase
MRPGSLSLLLATVTALAPFAQGSKVGFAEVQIANGTDSPLSAGIWYPTDALPGESKLGLFTQTVAIDAPVTGRNLPLVVLSHGGGGSYQSHYDTALALAHAGFVAAAVSHAGDTFDDQSRVLELWRRPQQLRLLVSYMLHDWPHRDKLDASRIGAFGFSNGGFTMLVTAGGVPDLDRTGKFCQLHPDQDLCLALKHAKVDAYHLADAAPADAWVSDSRVKAHVIAAPAFAFTFGKAALRDVHGPIQLWRAAEDRHQPTPYYEETLRHNLPRPPEYHIVPGAGHYDFLPPCSHALTAVVPLFCGDPSGFDRARFHAEFNAQIVRFFRANLF